MPLIVNGIKSKENDKVHGIENHDFFLWNTFLFIVRILIKYLTAFIK